MTKKEFRVVWSIKLEKMAKAKDSDEASEIIQNIDCQHDRGYVEDSFDIEKIKKVK